MIAAASRQRWMPIAMPATNLLVDVDFERIALASALGGLALATGRGRAGRRRRRHGDVRPPRAVDPVGALERWRFPGLALELHPAEAEGFYLNLASPDPKAFVMWRADPRARAAGGHRRRHAVLPPGRADARRRRAGRRGSARPGAARDARALRRRALQAGAAGARCGATIPSPPTVRRADRNAVRHDGVEHRRERHDEARAVLARSLVRRKHAAKRDECATPASRAGPAGGDPAVAPVAAAPAVASAPRRPSPSLPRRRRSRRSTRSRRNPTSPRSCVPRSTSRSSARR